MTILIDSKHIGTALRHTRHTLCWNTADMAKIIGVSEQDFIRCEMGLSVLTHDQLEQIFTMGFMMMRARRLQHEIRQMHKLGNKSE